MASGESRNRGVYIAMRLARPNPHTRFACGGSVFRARDSLHERGGPDFGWGLVY